MGTRAKLGLQKGSERDTSGNLPSYSLPHPIPGDNR
jgi:hypothetical protein